MNDNQLKAYSLSIIGILVLFAIVAIVAIVISDIYIGASKVEFIKNGGTVEQWNKMK